MGIYVVENLILILIRAATRVKVTGDDYFVKRL